MKIKLIFLVGIIALIVLAIINFNIHPAPTKQVFKKSADLSSLAPKNAPTLPIFIQTLRQRSYPSSKIEIEETLSPGTNYQRYIASYTSDNLKIYGLFTIPNGTSPKNGWPAIIFIHGHLDPLSYQTTERYVAYQDGFARSEFVTFKPDLRGHGKSEGTAVNSSFSDGYVVDTLNLLSTFKSDSRIDPKRIGVWGHSMGGGISLRDMVVSKDIKAGVIWAGVVGNYQDLLEKYFMRAPWMTSQTHSPEAVDLFDKFGSPSANPKFWNQLDPYAFLSDISGPVQLHHGTADDNVPIEFSRHLQSALKAKGKVVEEYEYANSDHNIAQGFNLAMQRSIEFFRKYL